MLIHSVTPAHMLIEQPAVPEYTCKQVGNSFLEGVETARGLQLSRIYSTDPAMYLKKDFSPGAIYKG